MLILYCYYTVTGILCDKILDIILFVIMLLCIYDIDIPIILLLDTIMMGLYCIMVINVYC